MCNRGAIFIPTQRYSMQQLVQANRRDLDEEDFQMLMDRDEEQEERQLRARVLFAVQGLGGVRTVVRGGKTLQAYITGPHCEESIKDLVKLIRNQPPHSPKTLLMLSAYNIIESDLIQLLILQVEDKKLSFWIIALMSQLTTKPHPDTTIEDKQLFNTALCAYKSAFIKHQCMTVLVLHIAEYLKTQSRLKAHHQMLQFIVILLRNLLQIDSDNNQFIVTFFKEDVMDALLYLLQTQKQLSNIDICLLEIFYYSFTCINPQLLHPISLPNPSLKSIPLSSGPTRHSRFMPNFYTRTPIGTKRLFHSLQIPYKETALPFQKKQPVQTKEKQSIERIELGFLPKHYWSIEVGERTVGHIIEDLSKEFIENSLESLVGLLFESIYRETARVSEHNVIQYLEVCAWSLSVVRQKYCVGGGQFGLSSVAKIMEVSHFELVYKILYREATREKRKNFKINLFRGAMHLFKQYIEVVADNALSMSTVDRRNATALMNNVFRHDIARIFRFAFLRCNYEGILLMLIEVTYKFFSLLKRYASGKTLTLNTNKMLKRKKVEEEEVQEEQQVEEYVFQERKYNEKSQFAIVAEYQIVEKYLRFLRGERFLTNSSKVNEAIFFYFQQIKNLLDGQWLFYQIDTMAVFQKMLASTEFRKSNRNYVVFVSEVCRKFIRHLQRNRLLLVQSLFRCVSVDVKENILSNYEKGVNDYDGEGVANLFTDE